MLLGARTLLGVLVVGSTFSVVGAVARPGAPGESPLEAAAGDEQGTAVGATEPRRSEGGRGSAAPLPVPSLGTYAWPVRGPVLRPFEPPAGPFGPGHRGIDIGTAVGTPVRAAASGRVAFAGPVAGRLFVSIDHPDGIRTTYSWLSAVLVRRGDVVRQEATIARSGQGHDGAKLPHLHFGTRLGSLYLDPMLLLERPGVVGLVRLAPLERDGD